MVGELRLGDHYRQQVGLFTRPSVGVVVQALLNPDSAGVMFTKNPVTGADERVIEASWGLGEAVVAGIVIPDHFRSTERARYSSGSPGGRRSRSGAARRRHVEEKVPAERVEQLCLDDDQLRRSTGSPGGASRSTGPLATSSGRSRRDALPAPVPGGHAGRLMPSEALPSSASAGAALRRADKRESADRAPLQGAPLRQGRNRHQGGSGGAAFFVIESGEAKVFVDGQHKRPSLPGDFFGEVALLDGEGALLLSPPPRARCRGITSGSSDPSSK